MASREAALESLGEAVPHSGGLPELPAGCLVLVAVPDDALRGVLADLARGPLPERGVVAHVSGSHGLAVFPEDWPSSVRRAAFHPLRSFATRAVPTDGLGGALVAVTTDDDAVFAELADLARAIGGRPARLDDRARVLYHLGASIASNGLVGLLHRAEACFREAGIAPDDAREALVQLARGTLENVGRLGPVDALTGPVARGDTDVLEAHVTHGSDVVGREGYEALIGWILAAAEEHPDREDAAACVRRWIEGDRKGTP